MFAVDMLWIGFIAKNFYQSHLGFLIKPTISWMPAVAFYLLYIVGLVVFVLVPALQTGQWTDALWRGALLGLIAYGTYDLTNAATIPNWPAVVTVVDMLWGAVAAGLVSTLVYQLAHYF